MTPDPCADEAQELPISMAAPNPAAAMVIRAFCRLMMISA
jgi:hypothetical protein